MGNWFICRISFSTGSYEIAAHELEENEDAEYQIF